MINTIGFTGTRQGMTARQRDAFREWLAGLVVARQFHHGDCRGADEQAHGILQSLPGWASACQLVIHPPTVNKFRAFCVPYHYKHAPRDYLVRNVNIVDQTDMLAVAPLTTQEQLRSGTWSAVRYARRAGKPRTIFWPDGRVEIES